VAPSGGSPERLTEHATAVNFITPLDTRTLLYIARADDRSGPWLWSLDVESKISRRVSSGLGQYTSVSASRDGRRVVTTVANPTSSCGGCRYSIERRPIATRCPIRCRRRGRSPRGSPERRCSIYPPAEPVTGCGAPRVDGRPKSGTAEAEPCSNRPRCRPTAAAPPSSSGVRGSGSWSSFPRTAGAHARWLHRSRFKAPRAGTAVGRGRRPIDGAVAQGPGLLRFLVVGGCRLVTPPQIPSGRQTGALPHMREFFQASQAPRCATRWRSWRARR
jgi:hypothetical protein